VKPLLFVTGHLPAYRAGALERLHEREQIELALFGGRAKHGGGAFTGELAFPRMQVQPLALEALLRSGRYRAVVCPTGGRLAPLATWAGARRAGIPLILWASLWAHPRTPFHGLSYLPLRRLYGSADAVVTYGPHVSDYVGARGARNVHVAPQSVDNDFWRSPQITAPGDPSWPKSAAAKFLFVGRPAREKGLEVLLAAWRRSRLRPAEAMLVLAGAGSDQAPRAGDAAAERSGAGIVRLGAQAPPELRNIYAAADALVLPSISTRAFREPWGLVVNEAMNRGLPVIASDAVGAAAGGLVRDGENGLIVPEGDSGALAEAISRLAADPPLRARLGRSGARDVLAYSHEAWAEGFSRALATVGLSRGHW
jgi:glycosyltransferase involved in cell wall biosynthesis